VLTCPPSFLLTFSSPTAISSPAPQPEATESHLLSRAGAPTLPRQSWQPELHGVLPTAFTLLRMKASLSTNPQLQLPTGNHALAQDSQSGTGLVACSPCAHRSFGPPLSSEKRGNKSFFGNYPRPNPAQRRHEMGTAKCPGGTEDSLHLLLRILLSTNTGFQLN